MRLRPASRQDGAFAVIFGMLLVPLLLALGLAVDLSIAYTRRTDMQDLADSVALGAAHMLDGSVAGVAAAVARAQAITTHNQQFATDIEWTPAALAFSSTASDSGSWYAAGAVDASIAATLRYARFDTSQLANSGLVDAFFSRALDSGGMPARIVGRAIAGASAVQVMPLAICALNNSAVSSRSNAPAVGMAELLEFGFRRGVSYNLLNLNPNGTVARSYLVNPVDFPPNASDLASHHSLAALKPFVCNGTLATASVGAGSTLYVEAPFPPALATALNSRFDPGAGTADSSCDTLMAPPDANVRNYLGYPGTWMSAAAANRASALPDSSTGALLNVAQLDGVVAGTDNSSYGTLWAFARPLRYNAGAADGAGLPFAYADWQKLYLVQTGPALASSYTASPMPYNAGSQLKQQSSAVTSLFARRILNVPLLSCPVAAGGTATVLAVGRFLLMSPATGAPSPGVHAEFGGLVTAATALKPAAVALLQ
ncbi:MAG: pilus assembly protein TadG-related protein [Pseudomonadota bacterium]